MAKTNPYPFKTRENTRRKNPTKRQEQDNARKNPRPQKPNQTF
jgi:hypothetical protein